MLATPWSWEAACSVSVAGRHRREARVSGEELVLRLTLEPGEPVAASITTDADRREMAFSGWLGLIEVLDMLRRRADHLDGERGER